MHLPDSTLLPPRRAMPPAPAPWSLDLRSWHLTWSDEVRSLHEVPASYTPTLWQALGFVDPDDLPELLERAATAIRIGAPFTAELGIVTAGGTRKQVRLEARPLPDTEQRPRLLEGTLELLGAAGEAQAPSDAEARIAQLESALRDWEAFARAIPHELKAPLAIIEGFAAALSQREQGALSDRGRKHLESIRRSAIHARSLGEALLVLAPMSMQPMRWEEVDLSAIAWKFIDLLRIVDEARTVHVMVQPDMRVMGDPDLLCALVGNLVGNAWKFTSRRPVARIDFRMIAAGAQPAFCVGDDGVGFDMADAASLFNPLVRLHGPAEFEGTGMGLAIARQAVQRHAGRIWIDAGEGEGARVFFSLGAPPRTARGSA